MGLPEGKLAKGGEAGANGPSWEKALGSKGYFE